MTLIRIQLAIITLVGVLADQLRDASHRLRHEDDGMTTTEVAVVTFLLVGAAIVVMGIIFNAAQTNANNIPVPTAPVAG